MNVDVEPPVLIEDAATIPGHESKGPHSVVGEFGCPRQSHKLKIEGSNPSYATSSAKVRLNERASIRTSSYSVSL